MFEVGFSELLLIMGLALLVLGPEKLPKVVSEIGRWMGRARAMARQFREQLEDESLELDKRRQTPSASTSTSTSTNSAAASSSDTPVAPATPTMEDAVQRHAEAAVADHVPLGGDMTEPPPATTTAAAPDATEPGATDPDRPAT